MISTTVISYSEKQSTLEAHATWKIEFPWEADGRTWIAEVSQNVDSYVYSSVYVLHPYHLLFQLCPPGTYACVTVRQLITEGWASTLAPPCCCCSFTKSCPTLCDTMDYSPPDSSVHVLVSRQDHWSRLPFLLQRIWRDCRRISCIAGRCFTTEPPGEPYLQDLVATLCEFTFP